MKSTFLEHGCSGDGKGQLIQQTETKQLKV